jgi:hypothetical protein
MEIWLTENGKVRAAHREAMPADDREGSFDNAWSGHNNSESQISFPLIEKVLVRKEPVTTANNERQCAPPPWVRRQDS